MPSVVDQLIKGGKANVAVLETNDKWFGVTYRIKMWLYPQYAN